MTMDDEHLLIEQRNNNKKFRITVEPVGFLFVFASIIQGVVIQNLYLDKTCVVNFQLNLSDCSAHNHTSEIDSGHATEIQKYVSNLNIYGSLIENVPSIILVLFLGPWSERNGRKLPMIIPLIGHICSVSMYILNYYFTSWPAEYILFASLPCGLFGGTATLLMALNSYIADITTTQSRTSRISIMYGCMAISYPIANFISIYIYSYGGFFAIWGTSLGLGVITLCYIIFFIKDSRGHESEEDQIENNYSSVNNYSPDNEESDTSGTIRCRCDSVAFNLWECFAVTFQPRNGYKRACLSILLASMCVYVYQIPGSVTYLYTRKLFDWDQPQFALFSTISSLTAVLGSLILLPLLSSYFEVRDVIIGIIAILGNIAGCLTIAFAVSPLMLYLASFGYVLTASIGVVIRSMLSKLVLSDELSHVYSVLASFESLVPLISTFTYNLIYKATIDFFPGCVFVVFSCLLVVLLILLSVVLILQWKEKNLPMLTAVQNITV
uniref:Proton-coupled folate transporter n=1 Tax=Daphnia galeata TaxID=27404 RepID=A0A8J2RIN9_9CRUS|nr:unnamed protein product [Daphnia galeata]